MKKFFVLFGIPATAVQEWMTTADEPTRKKQTEEMMQSWKKWMTEHESQILDKGLPLGKTRRITSDGVTDTKNDLNWYLVVEAESHEAAANMLKDHPQLHIKSAYIEVMDASRPGMQ